MWGLGDIKYGTRGRVGRGRQIQGRTGRGMRKLIETSEVNAISVTFLVNMS